MSLTDRTLADHLRPVRGLALRLLDLQLWCIGQDVRSGDNLLMAYGFSKNRRPEKTPGSSEYAVDLAPDRILTVWGYGVHLAQGKTQGGLFVRRFGFTPRYTPAGFVPQDHWHSQAWKRVRAPRTATEEADTLDALARLASAFSDYERWIIAQQGMAYRRRNLAQWHRRPVVPAEEIVTTWESLATHFAPAMRGLPEQPSIEFAVA